MFKSKIQGVYNAGLNFEPYFVIGPPKPGRFITCYDNHLPNTSTALSRCNHV